MNAGSCLRLVWMAAIGFILAMSSGCGNKYTLAMGLYSKVVVYPQKGDTLRFSNFQAMFQGPTPCENPDNHAECKINVDAGHYRFKCDKDCVDPEVEVGSIGIQRAGSARIPPPDTVVVIWCDQGAIHIDPKDATIQTGKEIAWENDGSPNQAVPGWTVTPPSFCADPASSISKDHPYCNVGAPNKYSYTVKANPSTSCSDATGTVTITPNQ